MILMLDFDGVLHPQDVYEKNGRPVLCAEGELFMWAPLLVRALDPFPDIQIVLSTAWVYRMGFEYACKALPDSLRNRVIGVTFDTATDDWNYMTRYEEIGRYVSVNKIEHWISVDDDHVGWAEDQRYRLVQSDPDWGISEPQVFKRLQSALLELSLLRQNSKARLGEGRCEV